MRYLQLNNFSSNIYTPLLFALFCIFYIVPSYASEKYIPKSNISLLRAMASGYMLIGTSHTFDAEDPQLRDIENLFYEFEPTLVLLEGGEWPVKESLSESLACCAEMGFLQFLALKNGVKVSTWEGDTISEAAFVLDAFKTEELKLFYALRLAPQILRHKDEKLAKEKMEQLLSNQGDIASRYNIDSKPYTIEQLNQMLSLMVGANESWTLFNTNVIFDDKLREPEYSRLQSIKDKVNEFRDSSAIAKVNKAIEDKERVMYIGGQLHFLPVMNGIIE